MKDELRIKNNQMEEVEGIFPEYPYVCHFSDHSMCRVPWHWHEEVEFNYVVDGAIEVTTINRKYVFRKGEAFFMNGNVLAMMEIAEGETKGFMESHLFHPTFLGGHFRSIFEIKYLSPVLQDKRIELVELRGENENQKDMIRRLRQAARYYQEEDKEFQIRNLFSEIWLGLLEEIKNYKYSAKPGNQDRIQTMLAYIHQNYQEKVTLEDIAESAAVGKRECLRCFQDCIGKSPIAYLLEYRLDVAERLLRTTDEPVLTIALETGFSNGAYFGKVFRENYGMSPGAYRKKRN